MDWLILILAHPGVHLSLSGAFGGIARWLMIIILDKKMAIRQGIATVLLGGILGFFVTPQAGPAISEAFELVFRSPPDPEKAPIFNAFLLGVLGVLVIGFAIDTVTSWTQRKLAGDQSVPTPPKPDGGS